MKTFRNTGSKFRVTGQIYQSFIYIVYDLYFQGPQHCNSCRTFQDGPYCVASCPELKYPDADGVCLLCHENCDGCTGPSDQLGPGGCLVCSNLLLNNGSKSRTCLNKTISRCPPEFYFSKVPVRVADNETEVSAC